MTFQKKIVTEFERPIVFSPYIKKKLICDFHAWMTFLVSLFAAMQQVLENTGEQLTSTSVKDIDLLFLRGIMESPIVRFPC